MRWFFAFWSVVTCFFWSTGAAGEATGTESLHRPVVTSLSFSPDGKYLAVSGAGEVVVFKADLSDVVARLSGGMPRIESVHFSPDSSRLAVAAGYPAEQGVIQIWDITTGRQTQTIETTEDTIYAAAWSPDGQTVAVGAADNSVRAFDATTGEQTLFMGSHSDWPLDVVFSVDGSHLVSVGRDQTVKLTEVATERFVDNVTSITPGALKGDLTSVSRHPQRDDLLVGGSDGVPRIFRMHRTTKRVIGDDAQLLRELPGIEGRLFGVAYDATGLRAAAVSSLNGHGQLGIYTGLPEDSVISEELKRIYQKKAGSRNGKERKLVADFIKGDITKTHTVDVDAGLYAVAFSVDGRQVVVAGSDGFLRSYSPETGELLTTVAVPVTPADDMESDRVSNARRPEHERVIDEPTFERADDVVSLSVEPSSVRLTNPFETAQLIATATLQDGTTADVTRVVCSQELPLPDAASLTASGLVLANDDGAGVFQLSLGKASAMVKVTVTGVSEANPLSYHKDVTPVLSKLGCNQGTCHGAKDGKEGFKLSLRGYDSLFDVRALTDDLKSRRVDLARPDDSLMLLKAVGYVPHGGDTVVEKGADQYEVMRRWIAEGAVRDEPAGRLPVSISLSPTNPVIQSIGYKQQLRVVATYGDGSTRDVTAEAFVTSGNTDVASVSSTALVTTLRRGEAPMLARYEGRYAATTVTVMGDRTGFEWQQPESWGTIDDLVATKWQRMKIRPSEVTDDASFLRRVTLDLTGLPPTADQVRAFLADDRPTRVKRDDVIDQLIGSKEFVDYWTNKWADLLAVNRKFLGAQGAKLYRDWIRKNVAENRPYDEFAYDIITANGSNKTNPAASYYKVLRDPLATMENTTHLFLAVRFNCNKCHDHPFERWTQDQYYETAAYFARVGFRDDKENSKGKRIGGTAVEGGKPVYEVIFEKDQGEVTHDRTGVETAPKFPYETEFSTPENANRREQLAAWMTSPDNQYFASSYVNRLWGYLMGVGLIDPLDDIRAGNPPSNPELLDYLEKEFIESGFDMRHVLRLIVTSRAYQLDVATNRWNEDDQTNFSHAMARRLPAEVLFDTVYTAVGAEPKIPGVAAGTRAIELPDAGVKLADGFLANFGRPARETACECERSNDLNLGPVMALVSGPTIGKAVSDTDNTLTSLVAGTPDDAAVVRELFLRILNRPATEAEVTASLELFDALQAEHDALVTTRDTYIQEIAPRVAQAEADRLAEIASIQKQQVDRRAAIAADVAKAKVARQMAIDAAEQKLDDAVATVTDDLTAWAADQTDRTPWTPLTVSKVTSNERAQVSIESDGSVYASGRRGRNELYTVTATLDASSGVTGVKLDALIDERLPNFGPGRAGNFVITEFRVEWAPVPTNDKAKPKFKNVKLAQAAADFSQSKYAVKTAINGQYPRDDDGWAIAPQVGQNHWATFAFEKPVQHDGEIVLKVVLDQRYQDGEHTLGRFRLSTTSADDPLAPGLPAAVIDALAVNETERTETQSNLLIDYVARSRNDLIDLRKTLWTARKPLPDDPELVRLAKALKRAERPVPEDPKLVRFNRAVELSTQQIQSPRLTAAQDLAWALINSPAFLFNH